MYTMCLRGGCLTGPNHCGVEQHGFLSYLVRSIWSARPTGFSVTRENRFATIFIRSTSRARSRAFIESPRRGAVYNIGGGRANSCSILEAIEMVEQASGIKSDFEYVEQSRVGDHVCYISDLTRITNELNGWSVSVSLPEIIEQLVCSWRLRLNRQSPVSTEAGAWRKYYFVNRSFWPDTDATGFLLTELTEDLARSSSDRDLRPCRILRRPGAWPLLRREDHGGVKIVRTFGARFSKRILRCALLISAFTGFWP